MSDLSYLAMQHDEIVDAVAKSSKQFYENEQIHTLTGSTPNDLKTVLKVENCKGKLIELAVWSSGSSSYYGYYEVIIDGKTTLAGVFQSTSATQTPKISKFSYSDYDYSPSTQLYVPYKYLNIEDYDWSSDKILGKFLYDGAGIEYNTSLEIRTRYANGGQSFRITYTMTE